MKISELIAALESDLEEYGDLEVRTFDPEDYWSPWPIEITEIKEFEDTYCIIVGPEYEIHSG